MKKKVIHKLDRHFTLCGADTTDFVASSADGTTCVDCRRILANRHLKDLLDDLEWLFSYHKKDLTPEQRQHLAQSLKHLQQAKTNPRKVNGKAVLHNYNSK